MLGRQNFRRRHQRHLVTVLDRDRGGFERHDCFAASHVAFEHAMHRKWPFQIAAISASTRFCAAVGLKGKIRFSASRILSSRMRIAIPRRVMFVLATQRQGQLVVEKLLEYQAHLRGAAKLFSNSTFSSFGGKCA